MVLDDPEGGKKESRMSNRHKQGPKLNRKETETHGIPFQKTRNALEEGQPGNKLLPVSLGDWSQPRTLGWKWAL